MRIDIILESNNSPERVRELGELAEACEIPSHMASEHLRLMQRCGFLDMEKEGRCVYYTVAEPHLASIMVCIEARFGSSKQSRSGVSA